jgi:hypothetical protein
MAERRPRAQATPLWELLDRLDVELQRAILDLAGARAAKRLRGASRAARTLVNSRVERIRLSAGDVATLPLRLHERFPRLARLGLARGADGGLAPDTFADFAMAELAPLSSLVELDLRACKSLGTAAAVALRDCCPQLQRLNLGSTGAGGSSFTCAAPLCHGCNPGATPITAPSAGPAGVASPYALQVLASLTRLTLLNLSNTAVSAGLQQLTSLQGLEWLNLMDCEGVTDAHLQPLSALTGLTWLDASHTSVAGSSLAALTSLRRLDLFSCSSLDAAALSDVAQLTRLTLLDLSRSATGAQPAQLAQLAQLTNLQDLRLWGHTIRGHAAALLQLPRLGELCADGVAVPLGQDLSGCAITRLVLEVPTAAGLQALPQLPTLQSLIICTAHSGLSCISVQTQLTELAVGRLEGVQASELAAALRGLKQLQALELGHAGCFDMACLGAVAGLQQLQVLWLDGGRQDLAPGMGDCWGVLHRCTAAASCSA